MLILNIPGRGIYHIKHVILDFNGTMALDGKLIEGLKERLHKLHTDLDLQLHVVTADTFGTVSATLASLPCQVHIIEPGDKEDEQKVVYLRQLGCEHTITIGNGSNDRLMLLEAAIGIAVIQKEGASLEAVKSGHILSFSILDALDLLIYPSRLIATLRGSS